MRVHRVVLLTIVLASLAATAHGQELQISPYVGGIVSSKIADAASFKNSTVYGLRWSMYVVPQFSVEANLGRQKDFRLKGAAADSHAYVFDLNGVYHVRRENNNAEPAFSRLVPFVTAGAGLLRADNNGFDLLKPNVYLIDGTRFFTINYGGGVQASRLAGPFGVRVDARGRTAPNMLGSAAHFFELSGGVTFNFMFPY
jgi:hypothetical protein